MEILHYLVGALTRNWGLKILALALAIVIYYSTKHAGDASRTSNDNDRLIFQEKR